MGSAPDRSAGRLFALLPTDERTPAQQRRLVTLIQRLDALPPPPDPGGHFPRYGELRSTFREQIAQADGDSALDAFLDLYAHLHMHEAPYTGPERRRMDETGGYWAHAGGLAPILAAPDHLHPDSVSADFGAGNGLQGLLFQLLTPHRRTVQIEISSEMVTIGRLLQRWLGIDEARVTWIADDVLNHTPAGMDLIYLYRPVRPEGEGRLFYRRFARALERSERPVVVLSIADCLRDFLSPRFQVFHDDGHLTAYRGPSDIP